jgi:hypothetical protein
MTPEVEKILKKVLECTKQSSERVYFAAFDRMEEIAKLGKRKQHRAAAIEALQQLALKAYEPLRGSAADRLVDLLTPADTDCLAFLRQGLKHPDIDSECARGLLKLQGTEAYDDAVALILDSKRSLDTRTAVLTDLSKQSGHPFDEDMPLYFDETTADDLPLARIRAWQKAGYPAYVPEKITIPTAALAKLGITLPADYAEFLQQHRRSIRYEYDDCLWELTKGAQLLTKIKVDGKSVPSVQQLKQFAASLKKATKADATEDHKGKPYPLERLAQGIAIGSSDSGDVLYLDPADSCSVWIFHPDGGDVELAAKTFKAWLRKADVETD